MLYALFALEALLHLRHNTDLSEEVGVPICRALRKGPGYVAWRRGSGQEQNSLPCGVRR